MTGPQGQAPGPSARQSREGSVPASTGLPTAAARRDRRSGRAGLAGLVGLRHDACLCGVGGPGLYEDRVQPAAVDRDVAVPGQGVHGHVGHAVERRVDADPGLGQAVRQVVADVPTSRISW